MKNDPNNNGMTYASHTLPSLHLFTPHQLMAPPNTHCMPITYPFIIHAIHKIPYHSIHNCIRARLVTTPHIQTTTCNRLLLSHLFPHNYNVPNMLHDALNRQKHLPLSTSFHASIMQHVHLQLHYTPRGSLLPTPIGSTHHLCMKLIHVPTEHTLQYYKKM